MTATHDGPAGRTHDGRPGRTRRRSAPEVPDTVALAARAARSFARAGVLRPMGPSRALRVAAAARGASGSAATLLGITAARDPHGRALVDDAGSLTWSELAGRAGALAAQLAALGAGPDRGVAIMCRNHRGFVEALAAASSLGADAVLLNTEFPGPQLAQALERRDVAATVCDPELTDRFTGDQSLISSVGARHQDLTRLRVPRRAGAVTILSSGTTGAPKGAARAPALSAVLGPLVTILDATRLRSREPLLIGPPLFHGFGLSFLLVSLAIGAPMLLQRRFDAAAALQLIAVHRAGGFVGVPVMFQRMLAAPVADTSSIRAMVSAGAALPPHLATQVLDRYGDVLFNAYGSTETGFAALATPQDLRAAPGTVGRAPLGTRLQILDADRRPATEGHIFVGGALTATGYGKEVVDGLMNTGDLGRFDAGGRLLVDGREDDMIVSGGENVFPQEVEDVLAAHPRVGDVSVVGVEDAEFGQRLRAYVVPAGDATEDELVAHVKARLARYKAPREIVFVDEIPRTATGKALKRELVR